MVNRAEDVPDRQLRIFVEESSPAGTGAYYRYSDGGELGPRIGYPGFPYQVEGGVIIEGKWSAVDPSPLRVFPTQVERGTVITVVYPREFRGVIGFVQQLDAQGMLGVTLLALPPQNRGEGPLEVNALVPLERGEAFAVDLVGPGSADALDGRELGQRTPAEYGFLLSFGVFRLGEWEITGSPGLYALSRRGDGVALTTRMDELLRHPSVLELAETQPDGLEFLGDGGTLDLQHWVFRRA